MSADWTYKNECKCGHHRDSHFEGKHSCLGLYCECTRFWKEGEPEPKVEAKPPPPAHDWQPTYDEDAIWDDLFGPKTPRMP